MDKNQAWDYSTILRKLPEDDDIQQVLLDKSDWVRQLMLALTLPPPDSLQYLDSTNAKVLNQHRYLQQRNYLLSLRKLCPRGNTNPLNTEAFATIVFSRCIKAHEYGFVRQVGSLPADATLTCSARMARLVAAVYNSSLIRLDVAKHEYFDELISSPNGRGYGKESNTSTNALKHAETRKKQVTKKKSLAVVDLPFLIGKLNEWDVQQSGGGAGVPTVGGGGMGSNDAIAATGLVHPRVGEDIEEDIDDDYEDQSDEEMIGTNDFEESAYGA